MINKEKFNAYEETRMSGRCNMLDIERVAILSELTELEVKEIIQNYPTYWEKFKDHAD